MLNHILLLFSPASTNDLRFVLVFRGFSWTAVPAAHCVFCGVVIVFRIVIFFFVFFNIILSFQVKATSFVSLMIYMLIFSLFSPMKI